MKHYLASLDVFFEEDCVDRLVGICAANEAQAHALVCAHAKKCVGEGAVQEDPRDLFFESESSNITVRISHTKEVTPAVFEAVRDLVVVLGKADVGNLAAEPEDERARTLARRLGDQLNALQAPVEHSKLLHAVSASLGATDWQVLLAKGRCSAPDSNLAAFDGQKLWVLTGRCFGDDDDSLGLIWAEDAEQAKERFLRETLDLSEKALAAHTDNDPQYFLVNDELLGAVKNSSFGFTPMYQPR